jgi:hypothetical protein
MQPREHVLSQQVLEFLIAHQDNFLLGMQLVSLVMHNAEARTRESRPLHPSLCARNPQNRLVHRP